MSDQKPITQFVTPTEYMQARLNPISQEMQAQGAKHLMVCVLPHPMPGRQGSIHINGHGDFKEQTELMRLLAQVLNEQADLRDKQGPPKLTGGGLILPTGFN